MSISGEGLRQAMADSQVHQGMYIKRTTNTLNTAAYLQSVTLFLQAKYENTALVAAGESTGEV